MLAVIVGLLLTLALAVVVMVLVALPDLRSGSQILTPSGKQAVVRAGRQVRFRPSTTARRAWHRLIRASYRLTDRLNRLRLRIARGWAPISAALHEAMDRLENRDQATSPSRPAENTLSVTELGSNSVETSAPEPVPVVPEPPAVVDAAVDRGPVQARFDVEAITYKRSVGRPRSFPVDSGPIPITEEAAPTTPTGAADAPVIDLREGEDHEHDTDREHHSGSVRHAR